MTLVISDDDYTINVDVVCGFYQSIPSRMAHGRASVEGGFAGGEISGRLRGRFTKISAEKIGFAQILHRFKRHRFYTDFES